VISTSWRDLIVVHNFIAQRNEWKFETCDSQILGSHFSNNLEAENHLISIISLIGAVKKLRTVAAKLLISNKLEGGLNCFHGCGEYR